MKQQIISTRENMIFLNRNNKQNWKIIICEAINDSFTGKKVVIWFGSKAMMDIMKKTFPAAANLMRHIDER